MGDDMEDLTIGKLLGVQLKNCRKRKGYTQQQLADAVGISVMSIRRYESGERVLPESVLKRITELLDIPYSALLFGTTEEQPFWYVLLDQKLAAIGCSVGFDEDDAALWINCPDGTLGLTEDELKELNSSTDSFLRFKIEELKQKSFNGSVRFYPKAE